MPDNARNYNMRHSSKKTKAVLISISVLVSVIAVILWKIMPASADKQVVWQAPQTSAVYAVAADDIDGDTVIEVVYGGQDSKLYVRKYNHATRLTNPYQTFSITAGMTPEIIRLQDLDSDGKEEIIVGGSTSNKVEAYSFVNNTLSQLFSVSVSNSVCDLTVGQITDINGNTGIDVAAVTAANKVELVYNNAGTWTTGYTANTIYQPQRVESFVYSGGKDAVVVTTIHGIRTFLFESVDNPSPVWGIDGLTFGSETFNVFGALAVSNDIVNSSNINGTDGIPEIVVGTRDQKWGVTDVVVTLNGKTGDAVWYSSGDQAQMGRVNDIKIQNVRGTGAKRYIAVGTGLAKDGSGNSIDKNHVLLFDLNGSGLNTPNFKKSAALGWNPGEVLSVYQGYIDHYVTDNGDNTHITAVTGAQASGQNSNKVLVFNYNFGNLTAPSWWSNDGWQRWLATDVSYTWNPRSTYWIDCAAINPHDKWRDIVFVHPGDDGVEVASFDNRAPALNSYSLSPSPVLNPWYNNVTYNITASEGSYVRVEILKNDGSTLVKDLGWKVADFNGTSASTSFVWDGKYTSGTNYDQTSYRVRLTTVDNEKQFDGDNPLTVPPQDALNRITNNYGPYTVNSDLVAPSLSLGFYKDTGCNVPLAVYNGKPITTSGSPVYVKVTGSESLIASSVYFSVYDVHLQAKTLATWFSGNSYAGTWNLNLPAQNGEARIEAEARDAGGNFAAQTSTVLVDNSVTKPTATATNNLNGKVVLSISGKDPDHQYLKIYRSTVSGFACDNDNYLLTTLYNPASSTYEDKNVQPNQIYYYRVRQTDFVGNTIISDEVLGKSIPGLTFSVDYYSDSAMTQPLPKNPDGKYAANLRAPIYIKFTSVNPLTAEPTFKVDAPGSTVNDITVPTTAAWVSGTVYKGTWGVAVSGNDGPAGVMVTATDIYGQALADNVPSVGGTVMVDTTAQIPYLWATPGPDSADLTWTRENDNENTKIYRSTNPSFTPFDSGEGVNLIATVSGAVYHNPDLDSAQIYYYKIVGIDCAGNVSAASNQVSVQPEASGPHPAPVIKRADPTSKQIVYIVFDEPVIIRGNPATWTITQNVGGTPPTVYSAEVIDDRRVIKLVLSGEQGTGNQLTPLTYTLTLTGIEDDYGTALPEDNVANRVSWEAFTPHGKFSAWSGGTIPAGSSTPLCGLCHSAHSSVGNKLLPDVTIKKVCLICHSSTGSSMYRVEGEFVSRNVYGLPYSYSLHKSLDSDDPGYDYLSCVDCHNPHGDVKNKTLNNTIYPKLLRAVDAAGNKYYEGNQVCLTCHGNTDRGFEGGTYYAATAGNHINPADPNNINASNTTGPVHYDNINFGGFLNPASGTNITCMKCHEKHGSQNDSLLDNSLANTEEALCFKSGCHGTVNPAKNKYDSFYGAGIVSRHDVSGSTGRGKIECSSCHGPHTVDNTNTASTRMLSDPENTKLTSFVGNAFCLKCHDGTPPVKTVTATQVVPYTVYFNEIGFTSMEPGWNKTLFTSMSGHAYSGFSVATCVGYCHSWHGTTNPWLIRAADYDTTYAGSFGGGNCFGLCHGNNVAWNGQNINTEVDLPYSAAYTHPTFTVNGVHSNTEDWSDKSVTRHSECYDCHDQHSAGAGRSTAPFTADTETGINGRIKGVFINDWDGATWSNWDTVTPDWTLEGLIPGTGKQYQLCLKCHSKYAYDIETSQDATGTAPHNTPSSVGYWAGTFKQTDIAKEFNPDNPAYHAVIGESKIPEYVYNSTNYRYGKFANGWTATSTLKCGDCHGYDTSVRRGPHGSPNRFILRALWNTDSNTASATGKGGTSNHLCFLCHDYDFYTGADQGSANVRSQFSRAGSYNLHKSGGGTHGSAGCVQCHGAVPHGWNKTDSAAGGLSLATTTDSRPYSDGVGITAIHSTNNLPEGWKGHGAQWSCQKSCH